MSVLTQAGSWSAVLLGSVARALVRTSEVPVFGSSLKKGATCPKKLILYTNPMSRGRVARWMLEEIGPPVQNRDS